MNGSGNGDALNKKSNSLDAWITIRLSIEAATRSLGLAAHSPHRRSFIVFRHRDSSYSLPGSRFHMRGTAVVVSHQRAIQFTGNPNRLLSVRSLVRNEILPVPHNSYDAVNIPVIQLYSVLSNFGRGEQECQYRYHPGAYRHNQYKADNLSHTPILNWCPLCANISETPAPAAATAQLVRDEIGKKGNAWKIHLSLFPVAQRVLNPPFINPHLPKMYSICRDFHPYPREEEIPALVMLEISEYARRPKLEKIPRGRLNSSASFMDIESAIRQGAREKAAALLYAFQEQKGKEELARRLLLLGSGYLDQSLGHSVSCTAIISLEMMERTDQDPWPTLATLADYFCKGQFHTPPDLRKAAQPFPRRKPRISSY